MNSGLCVVMHSFEMQLELCFLNLYGPYTDRKAFWNNLSVMDCFNFPNLVVGGDLNFSFDSPKFGELKQRRMV